MLGSSLKFLEGFACKEVIVFGKLLWMWSGWIQSMESESILYGEAMKIEVAVYQKPEERERERGSIREARMRSKRAVI